MIRQLLPKDLQNNLDFEATIPFSNQGFDTIEFDSRDISSPQNTLFVCIDGQKSNGHHYIQSLIGLGVENFLVSDKKYISEQANFFYCPNTIAGFQKIASYIRQDFTQEIIAITGSNGKTIVKEWLGQLLSVQWNVCKSPKSFNSQIGVPYSVSKLAANDCAIFETGISKTGEMHPLAQIIKPSIGIFTNIGDAHSEGFESIQQKLEEKLLLFQTCSKIIYCSNQQAVDDAMKAKFSPHTLITWGSTGKYKVAYALNNKTSQITVNEHIFEVHFIDDASLENASHAIVCALELGFKAATIQYGLSLLKAVDMRFELKEGSNGNLILNDSYNNDLAGLKMTLDLAKKLHRNESMILIASDFVHQNTNSEEWEKELSNLLNFNELKQVLWVGNPSRKPKNISNLTHFESTDELAIYLEKNGLSHTFIIIKGARQFEFEHVVGLLEMKQHITRVEVNLSRLIQNFNYFKSLIKPSTKIMVMVKAFAYGTGIVEVAKLLEINQVDYLAVAYTDEGVLLRNHGITKPIMVMNVVLDDFEQLEKYNLEPEIYSLTQLEYFASKSTTLLYHLKLDTGMHRLGFDEESLPKLIQFLQKNQTIKIQSILTHLAATDQTIHVAYTQLQLHKFEVYTQKIQAVIKSKPMLHALNSAGIEHFGKNQYDMVRLGIGIYGFGNAKNTPLKQVISLKTHVSQIRTLPKTETVGYGRKGKLTQDSRIATIPIGYADGYDRRFSNGIGSVLIQNQEAKVIGNVCMDMTMVDVTGINCKEGDEVIIYNDQLSIDTLATRIGTISYELLTHVSERVRRIFYFD